MTIEDSESQELLQITQAARGCISGTLQEWPHLKRALRKRGIKLPSTATAAQMNVACINFCEQNGIEF